MKKIFTLIVMAVLAISSYAQVNFTDPSGKVYEDGSVMDIYPDEEEMKWEVISFKSPVLVNTSSAAVSVVIEYNLRQLPEGSALSDCASGVCTNVYELGTNKTSALNIAAGQEKETQIEWNAWNDKLVDYVKGTCIVDFTIYVDGKKGQTVTVRYINGGADAINAVVATDKKHSVFTIDGKRATRNAKGLLVRDGKVVIKR